MVEKSSRGIDETLVAIQSKNRQHIVWSRPGADLGISQRGEL